VTFSLKYVTLEADGEDIYNYMKYFILIDEKLSSGIVPVQKNDYSKTNQNKIHKRASIRPSMTIPVIEAPVKI
jgi:hypothetical protein